MKRKILKFNVCILTLLFIAVGCGVEHEVKPAKDIESIPEKNKDVVEQQEIKKEEPLGPSKVVSAKIPSDLNFSGEPVNTADWDVRERLDYELTVNMYYHSKMQFYLKRANRWFPIIEPILKEEGLPDDFKYLAVAESALSQAISPSGAKGFWQFMTATGKEYDMIINGEIDERYHVEKSTRAACDYLKKAKKKFGNWTAAAASYNMGKAGLQRRMDDQFTDDYFDLKLNNETARYVFRIIAIKTIMKNPKEYGFNLDESSLYAPYITKSVVVDSSIQNVAEWAKSLDVNYKIVKKLNPWILKNSIPGSKTKPFEVLLPNPEMSIKPMNKYE